jgi:hypothetical protein
MKHTVHLEPEIATTQSFIVVGVALFLLIHAPPVRRGAWFGTRMIGKLIRLILYGIPRAILRLAIVRALLHSKLGRYVIRPAIPAAIAYGLVSLFGYDWPACAAWAGGVFVAADVGSNSRFGRLAEEMLSDALVRSGRHLARSILPGLGKYLLDLFAELIELLDRAIYRVDEWLRFKAGESSVTLVIKGAVGTVWFVIAYFLRLYVNLFIEPVVNPIKHFPTATVAAKLTLPFSPSMIHAIRGPMSNVVGHTLAGSFAAFTVFVIPGLAGFLVWELKENWKLYRKTRPDALRDISIGHHGESMVGFMKPGFHSGTIPKQYAKLRRATWKGDDHDVAKHREALHHVEEAIWKFADRELVSMLNEAKPFRAHDVAVHDVELGSNRVRIVLACPSVDGEHAAIVLDQQSGWLVAGVPQLGWIDRLADDQRAMFETALAGFYKLAGVELVREQLESLLRGRDDAAPPPYDISDEGLVVWPGDGYESEAVYALNARELSPLLRGAPCDRVPPSLTGLHAVFGKEPIRWSAWTRAWEQLAAGAAPPRIVVGPSLLGPSLLAPGLPVTASAS